jgi:hypothetical protein
MHLNAAVVVDKTELAEKCDRGFSADLRYQSEFGSVPLQIKDRVSFVSLTKKEGSLTYAISSRRW